MKDDAVRARSADPLLIRFVVLCVLQLAVPVLIAVSLVPMLSWSRLVALPVAVAAIGAGVLVFSAARRQRRSLATLYRELELLRQQRLAKIVDHLVASGNAHRVRLQLPAVTDPKLAPLLGDIEQVCTNAVRLAVEHDQLRSGYAEVFLNMFRRTQTLLLRQLQIIEQLEQDNRSASDLNRLYQLDHLVMRMRRNNENILVLSGTELVRKTKDAVRIDDLLRASISEIDSYQRVRLLNTPSVRVSNTAAGDLIRIVAELLDNATSFSPPDKQVTVKAELARHQGLSIGVIDNGIGMSDADIALANDRLRTLGSAEIARSRRLGLLVVGRLAGRHGFRVELFGGDDVEGVSALISVPSSVLVNEDEVRAELPVDVKRSSLAASTNRPGRGGSAVPMTVTVRRQDTRAPADVRVRRPSAWHKRTKKKQLTETRGSASSELLARAHSDVPGELPTRVPGKRPVPAGTDEPAVFRKPSRWFQVRDSNRPSTVDQALQLAERSNHQQDYTYTEEGLPLRQKGAHLFVDTADAGPAAEQPQTAKQIERDARQTRRRLSSYQQGVQKAKEQEARLRGTESSGGWTILEIKPK